MRNLFLLFLMFNLSLYSQEEKLEIDGAIQIANSIDPSPDQGTIRWTGSDFEGWTGDQWVSLTKGIEYIQDIENNYYRIVSIGTQVWMVENLMVTRYNDGTPVPLVTSDSEWNNTTSPAYTWYDNKSSEYGALYNYYTVADTNTLNICPIGWHVPSDAEWTILTDFLGGLGNAGGHMKEAGLSHWNAPNTGANNQSGFTGLPGGYRDSSGPSILMGGSGYWWSSNEDSESHAWNRGLDYATVDAGRYSSYKKHGSSVRCLKD